MTGEQELWDQLSRRDVEAFECFYRKHFSRIRSFVRAFVGNSQVADDIAQETFFQLWKHPNGFNPARSTLKNYIFGIARKRAADWWRHNPSPRESSTQRDAVVDEGSTLLLADAIERLEPEVRSLLWLREVEGYSYTELSEIFQVPLGTVQSRLFAARQQLRRVWKSGS